MEQFLDKQVFMSLLHYEELMIQGQFDREIVEQLITLYASCVEYYDSLRDPIKFYFLEKIQILLAHEQTLKEILTPKNGLRKKKETPPANNYNNNNNNNNKNNNIGQETKQIIIDHIEDEGGEQINEGQNNNCFSEFIINRDNTNTINTLEDEESDYYDLDSIQGEESNRQSLYSSKENKLTMQQMKLKYKQNYKQVKYSISKKRLERSKRVGMYLQMHEEQNTNQANQMGSLYQSYVDNNEKQANTVKQNLNQQQLDFEKRLQRRKTLKEGSNNILIEQLFKKERTSHHSSSKKEQQNLQKESDSTEHQQNI